MTDAIDEVHEHRKWVSATQAQAEGVTTHPELEALLPGLEKGEATSLRDTLTKDGCLHPGLVARVEGALYLLDGHHRRRICQEEGIPFSYLVSEFGDLGQVKMFMLRLQLGRRNLEPGQRAMLALQLEEEVAAAAHRRMVGGKPVPELAQGRTVEKLAEIAGVGKTTIQRARAVKRGAPDLARAVFNGETNPNNAYDELQARRASAAEPQEEEEDDLDAEADDLEQVAATLGRFSTLIVNVPWDELSDGQIAAWNIPDVAEGAALLWLPVPPDKLPSAQAAMEAWGFNIRRLLQVPTRSKAGPFHVVIAENLAPGRSVVAWHDVHSPANCIDLIQRFQSESTLVVNPEKTGVHGVTARIADGRVVIG